MSGIVNPRIAVQALNPHAEFGTEEKDEIIPAIEEAKKMGIKSERVLTTVQAHGNTSAASIPLALSVSKINGHIKKNDLIVTEAIGGGLAWGSLVIRW